MKQITEIQFKTFELLKTKLQINIDDYDEDLLISNGLDSINFINMILMIEECFGIEIPDQYLSLTELNTINNISKIIVMCISEYNGDDYES